MAQYVYTLRRVGKIVPPKRQILKNISLNFFPGAKIGVLGLNGSGKSTLLKIMAGVDTNFEGEVVHLPNLKIGFLPQEPQLDPEKTVREAVEEGLGETADAKKRLEEIYAAYAEPDADFDKLAAEQAKLEAIVNAAHSDSADLQLEVAADALRLPPWDQKIAPLSGGEKRRVALCRLLLSAIPLVDDQSGFGEAGLRESFTTTLTNLFISDNSLQVTDRTTADSILEGVIMNVSDAPSVVSQGEAVTKRRITISVKFAYQDKVQRKKLWEKTFSQWGDYDSGGGLSQRETGLQDAIKKVTEDILLETVSGW